VKSRHHARELALMTLYAFDFNNELSEETNFVEFPTLSAEEEAKLDVDTKMFARYLVLGTIENLNEIDKMISHFSINRPLEKIDRIDRNILRISLFSLLHMKNIHKNIVITEAVRLSQEYSRQMNYKFINGILDSIEKELDDYIKNS